MRFDSKEEMYFAWWVEELQSKGYVQSFIRSPEMVLFGGNKELKLREHIYTPDFTIHWQNGAVKALGLDFADPTIVEVKPGFDAHNMTRLFKLNQKWVYDKFGTYVQLVIPEKLFSGTFCPERYRLTDSGKALRKLKSEYLTIDEYIQTNRETVQTNRKRQLQ